MLVYPVLNETRCCHARLCTECYLQIRPPRHNKEPCPFCKYKRVEASYKGPRDKRDMDREELEEKQAADAMKRATVAAAAAAAAAATGTSSSSARSSTSTSAGSPQSDISNCHASGSVVSSGVCSGSSGAAAVPTLRVVGSGGASTCSDACLCANKAGSQAGPLDEFSSRYYHDKAPAIDPLLLEAMASEVTYASGAGCAGERGSGSSSGRLDMHMGEVRADGASSAAEQESVSYLAEVGHRIIRLPWHGADVDRAAVGSGMVSTGVSGRTQGRMSEEERMQHEEKLSLREAIRRSLIEM